MLRVPTIREVAALFTKSRTVAGVTKRLTDTASRLDQVAAHHEDKADTKSVEAMDHRLAARDLEFEVEGHQAEMSRAAQVGDKLKALLT